MSHSAYPPIPNRAMYLYTAYELAHASVFPLRALARTLGAGLDASPHPFDPLGLFAGQGVDRTVRAGLKVFDELTRRYGKPAFGIESVSVNGIDTDVVERPVLTKPFASLLHFEKATPSAQPRVLIVAPMSGHFSTLLRGTVRAMLPEHDVYVTDWEDARVVPTSAGAFDLDDYIDYLLAFIRYLGPNLHVVSVCQPAVAALAATALLAEEKQGAEPASLTLMAGPVDVNENPTVVNEYATSHELDWFRRNVITLVPFPHAGALRSVYPGFLQLAGFMGMNVDSHVAAYRKYFETLVAGDSDTVEAHRRFYDEYLAVMDITAEYFLQTIDLVFQKRALANGEFYHRDRKVDCAAITNTTLMTVEGERDDICGIGQTEAAHSLCTALSDAQRYHYLQPGVGHYGVFNGMRWRTEIQPRIKQMIHTVNYERGLLS